MGDDRLVRTTMDIDDDGPNERNGVPLLPRRPKSAPRPTMQLVNSLRDDV